VGYRRLTVTAIRESASIEANLQTFQAELTAAEHTSIDAFRDLAGLFPTEFREQT
jgi:hypothetical protein